MPREKAAALFHLGQLWNDDTFYLVAVQSDETYFVGRIMIKSVRLSTLLSELNIIWKHYLLANKMVN
jgi:hypothetical protein